MHAFAETAVAQQQGTMNFSELAEREALAPVGVTSAETHPRVIPHLHKPGQLQILSPVVPPTETPAVNPKQPSIPSPSPSSSFAALGDNDTAVPPDTIGAVGPDFLMTTLNTQVRVQDRNGGAIKTVSLDSFWSTLGNPSPYDPRVRYDPFAQRWIVSALADAQSPTAAVLVGVSQDSTPTNNWFLYRVPVDPNGQRWGDFDNVGFNKNWIVVACNVFPNNGGNNATVNIYAFDKQDLYGHGQGAHTLLQDNSGIGFTIVPAVTLDDTTETEYLIENSDGGRGKLRISTITGAVGSETLSLGTAFPSVAVTWNDGGSGDFCPQSGSTQKIDAGDSGILACFFRNGSIWCTQTAFLPLNSPSRTAVQWWQITPGGTVQQFGRMDDPSGEKFYAYGSMAVNASNDVLLGYSRFSASQYVSGNYAFRFGSDPTNTLRGDTVLKAGQGPYFKTNGGGVNRWGDFSGTVVDPVDDTTMWTIQEYAATPVGATTIDGSGRWGTWWGRIATGNANGLAVSITRPSDGMTYPSGANVTITAVPSDSSATVTNVEFFGDTTVIGQIATSPYTVTWTNPLVGSHSIYVVAMDDGGNQLSSAGVAIFVGDSKSPLGTWETTISGKDRGIAYLTYDDDFTLNGYGITLGVPGLFAITGSWELSTKDQLMGNYVESLTGTNILSGTFAAKATAGKNTSLKVSSGSGMSLLNLKGLPEGSPPDLSGHWTANVKQGKTVLAESYDFTPSGTDAGVFNVTGSGTGYTIAGKLIVTSRDAISAQLVADSGTNQVARALSGKFNPTKFTATLNGKDDQGNKISAQAIRQGP